MKVLYLVLGYLSLLLGIIGAFLPILPTTPFLILSAFCFKKSSKKIYDWLLNLRIIGNSLVDWEERRVIRRKYKVLAIIMLILSIGWVTFFKVKILLIQALLIIISLLIIKFIVKQKEN